MSLSRRGRKARGGHPLLCDLGQGLSTSELKPLSHRVDRGTCLMLGPWLVGKDVVVVTTRQPRGWLCRGWGWSLVFSISSPQKPPQTTHGALCRSTHPPAPCGLSASQPDCSLSSLPHTRAGPPELTVCSLSS